MAVPSIVSTGFIGGNGYGFFSAPELGLIYDPANPTGPTIKGDLFITQQAHCDTYNGNHGNFGELLIYGSSQLNGAVTCGSTVLVTNSLTVKQPTNASRASLFLENNGRDWEIASDQNNNLVFNDVTGTRTAGWVDTSGQLNWQGNITFPTGAALSGGSISGTSGSFTGALSTAAGFKSVVGPITYYDSGYPGGFVNAVTVLVNANNQVAATDIWKWVAPFSGSVVGFSAYQGGTTLVGLVQVYKNGVNLGPGINVIQSGASGYVTFAKGARPFVAGDVLQIQYEFSATGNVYIQGYMVVEMTA